MYAQDSIELLTTSGIQFKKHEDEGIETLYFAELLMTSGVVLCDGVKWLSFHRYPHRVCGRLRSELGGGVILLMASDLFFRHCSVDLTPDKQTDRLKYPYGGLLSLTAAGKLTLVNLRVADC